MNLNLSLLGQMITFALFIWFTMKYVWPPLTKAMQDRQKKISDGLAAAEQSIRDLELAERKVQEILRESKQQSSHIIEEANKRSALIVDDARELAREDGQRLIKQAQDQIQQELVKAKEDLRKQVGMLAIQTAEKILKKTIDTDQHNTLINDAIKEL
jgi:F-type H+-transporting ATPase subunit b